MWNFHAFRVSIGTIQIFIISLFAIQVDLLKFSELECNKRIDEVKLLRRDYERLYNDIATAKRSAPDPTAMFKEIQSLQEQVQLTSEFSNLHPPHSIVLMSCAQVISHRD